MITTAFIRFATIFWMSLLPQIAVALDEPHALRLLGHSRIDTPQVALTSLIGAGCASGAHC